MQQAFYGWRILALATFCQFVSVGFTVYLLGVYIEPFSREFSATPGQLGWAATIFTVTGALTGPTIGSWVDRGHIRQTLVAGACLLAAALLLLSQSHQLWLAGVACLLLALGASLVGIVPASALVVRWFSRRRGFALGIAAAGISVGGFLMPSVAAWLMVHFGWRASLLALGVFVALTLVPVVWLVTVSKPADIGQFPDGGSEDPPQPPRANEASGFGFYDLVRQRTFWIISVIIGLFSFCNVLLITFFVPFAREQGLEPQSAAFMLSIYAGFGILGKFGWGWLCDRFSTRRLMSAQLLVASLGWLPMLLWEGAPAMLATAVLAGMSAGGLMPVWASLVSVYFGPEAFGRVKGTMSFTLVALTVLPGPLGGYLAGAYGSYWQSFATLWWALPLAIVVSLFIPRAGAAQILPAAAPA